MLQVDLRATEVAPGTRVWRLFPGGDYKFLSKFLREGSGFLDLPSMILPALPMRNGPELLGRLLASSRTRQLIIDSGYQEDVAPVTDWQQFRGARRTSNRTRIEAAIINFYQEAKQGDYVIVPSALSDRRIYLGRFASNEITAAVYKYGARHPIPAREIQWLVNLDEGKISSDLAKALRHQHPFSLIERSRFYEVLSLVNGNYTFGDRVVSTIYNREADFLDADAALIGVVAKLAAVSCQAVSEDRVMGQLVLRDLLAPGAIEFTCSQESDIHSEGFTRLLSAAMTPLVAASLLAAFLTVDPAVGQVAVHEQLQQTQVVNSLAPNDPCIPIVNEATRMILNSVDIETTYQLCRAAHDAKRRAGLDPSAQGRVVQPNPPAQR